MRTFIIASLLQLSCSLCVAATLNVQPNGTTGQFTSISAAMAKVQAGDTILIADGVYREVIDFQMFRIAATGARTVVAAAPGARPVIKGSNVVAGWQRVSTESNGSVYVRRDWTVNSQQVFVNGKALQQIAGTVFNGYPLDPNHAFAKLHESQGGIWPGRVGSGRQDMTAESFYFDAAASSLYIKTTANITGGATVEVSVRPHVVFGDNLSDLELRGLTFEHANTTATSQSGAISLQANRVLLKDIIVRNMDGSCIDITGDEVRIENSSANYCGTVGMKVRGRNARLAGNETNFNNTRGFNKWWEAGGAKFVGSGGLRDSEVTAHRAYGNNGDGLWFDWNNDNNRIHHNVVAFNSGMGIHYEASSRAIVQGNLIVGNAQRGVYLPNTSQSLVEHNLIANNKMEGIAVVDERNAVDKGPPEFVPNGNRVLANVVAWSGKAALVLPSRVQGSVANNNVFVSAEPPTFSLDWLPLFKGLAEWRQSSTQDADSTWRQMDIPADILQLMNSRHELTSTALSQWKALLTLLANDPAARTTANQVRLALDQIGSTSWPDKPVPPRVEKTP
jgi:parallel beta-helix repeat protein